MGEGTDEDSESDDDPDIRDHLDQQQQFATIIFVALLQCIYSYKRLADTATILAQAGKEKIDADRKTAFWVSTVRALWPIARKVVPLIFAALAVLYCNWSQIWDQIWNLLWFAVHGFRLFLGFASFAFPAIPF